jgi:GTPase SAR1 family protein
MTVWQIVIRVDDSFPPKAINRLDLSLDDRFWMKVIVIGDWQAGKTSLVDQLCWREFGRCHYEWDCPISYHSFKHIRIDGKPAILAVWDTYCQELVGPLCEMYCCGANSCTLV